MEESVYFNKQQLVDAIKAVKHAAGSVREREVFTFVRLRRLDENRIMLLCTDGRHFVAKYLNGEAIKDFDICVSVDRLKAAVASCRLRRDVILEIEKDSLIVSQEDGPVATIQTRLASEFPRVDGFDGMDLVYSGDNPAALLSALYLDALKNAGSAALYDVAVFMPGVSYAMKPSVTVRCEASLVDRDNDHVPLVVHISTLELLKQLGEKITCMVDAKRVLCYDEDGYLLTFRPNINIGTFPEQAKLMFSSLREVGHVAVKLGDAFGVVKNAVALLDKLTPEPLYLELVASGELVKVKAEAGGQKYEDEFPAVCEGSYKIPIQAARLLAFLKSSCDEVIMIRVMKSEKIPDNSRFVHLVDSRLHEIVGIGKGSIEELDA